MIPSGFRQIFLTDECVCFSDQVGNCSVRNRSAQRDCDPVAHGAVDRLSDVRIRGVQPSDLFVGRGDTHIAEIIDVDYAEHMAQHIKDQQRFVASGEFPEWHFLACVLERKAEFTELFDVHVACKTKVMHLNYKIRDFVVYLQV